MKKMPNMRGAVKLVPTNERQIQTTNGNINNEFQDHLKKLIHPSNFNKTTSLSLHTQNQIYQSFLRNTPTFEVKR